MSVIGKQTITIALGDNEVEVSKPLTTPVDIDHSLVLMSEKTGSTYSPTYYMATAELNSAGDAVIIKRGNSGGYAMDCEVHIIEFDTNVTVQSLTVSGSDNNTYGYFANVQIGKTLCIGQVRTADDGQDLHDFSAEFYMEDTDSDNQYDRVTVSKYTNTKTLTAHIQIVEFDQPDIEVLEVLIPDTNTIDMTGTAVPNNQLDKTIVIMSNKAIGTWESQGYNKYVYLEQNGADVDYHCTNAGGGSWISRASVKMYFLKFAQSQSQHFRVVNSEQTDIDTQMPVQANSIALGNMPYGYMGSLNNSWDDQSGSITVELDTLTNGDLHLLRNAGDQADFSVSVLDLAIAPPQTDVFNYLHYVGRGVGAGVGVGIC